jgi:formylmethanofuran dehydrogenase subunit E
MSYTDDPVLDFERWDAEREARLEQYPTCGDCEEHIQDETAFYINGEWICEDCMD